MRVDVSEPSPAEGGESVGGRGRKRVDVWQTFRGNEWNNKGEKLGGGTVEMGGVNVNVGVLGERGFYEARQGCAWLPFQAN